MDLRKPAINILVLTDDDPDIYEGEVEILQKNSSNHHLLQVDWTKRQWKMSQTPIINKGDLYVLGHGNGQEIGNKGDG